MKAFIGTALQESYARKSTRRGLNCELDARLPESNGIPMSRSARMRISDIYRGREAYPETSPESCETSIGTPR
jgi:hypothetical protein